MPHSLSELLTTTVIEAGKNPSSVVELTRAMARLDDGAWRDFHSRYYDRLFRYSLTLHSGDRPAAEDALQSGFFRAVRHIRAFRDEGVFWSWLTLLIRCAAADQGRKMAANKRMLIAFTNEVS